MTKKRFAQSVFIILFLLYAISALGGDVVFYNNKGKLIDKAQYEKIIKERSQKIDRVLEQGYGSHSMKLEDPILLRKKRMEQWKKYREARR